MSTEPGVNPGADRAPTGPPWSVDDVADVHAGLYDASTTARLRALMAQDAQASAMLRALDATVDDLSLLPPLAMPQQYALRLDAAIAAEVGARGHGRTTVLATGGFSSMLAPGAAPAPSGLPTIDPDATTQRAVPPGARRPGPSGVVDPLSPTVRVPPPPRRIPLIPPVLPGADRVRGAAGEPHPAPADVPPTDDAVLPAGVASFDAHRAKRRRWIGGGLAVAAAAAAIAIISTVGLGGSNKEAGVASGPQAAATSEAEDFLTPGRGNVGALPTGAAPEPQAFVIEPGRFGEALDELEGRNQGLGSAPALASCLAANGVAGDELLGVSDVTYQGADAVAIAVAVKDDSTKATVLVVGQRCGPDGPDLLAKQTVTR